MKGLILIEGPNQSGKSRSAEQLLARYGGKKYYIATMRPCTQENLLRIEKHRQQRKGLGFQTIEMPTGIADAPVEKDSYVLLEDVSNLLSNAMFEKKETEDAVFADIMKAAARCRLLAAVTISDLREDGYTGETAAYIRSLNRLNEKLREQAAAVLRMQEGQRIWVKGGENEDF